MKRLFLMMAISLGTLQTVPGGTGRISGIVIQSGTDRPIEGVEITIAPAGAGTRPGQIGAYTDRLGRFELRDIAPGRYRLQWSRQGYFTPPVGTPSPDDSIIRSLTSQLGTDDLAIPSPPAATSVTVDVAANEALGGFVFTLIPGGVISGHVLDASGNSLVSATLTALRVNYESGRLVLRPAESTTSSDDRGNFRLHGLRPGEYYVRAEYRPTLTGSNEIIRTYFPGLSVATSATPITVNESGESPGADFSIPRNGAVKISGTVTGAAGLPRLTMSFYLLPADANNLFDPGAISFGNSNTNAADRAAGAFELHGVPPGQYNLCVIAYDNDQMLPFSGRVLVDVGSQDLLNVAIDIHPASDLEGRVILENGAGIRKPVSLRTRDVEAWLPRQFPESAPLNNVNPDGTFKLVRILEGRYSMTTATDDVCVVDLRQSGKSTYDDGFVGGNNAGPVEVVLSNQCGKIQVQVVDENQKPAPNAFVSLVPSGEHRRNPLLYKRATFDVAASKYLPIELIPPGEYKMFAWDYIPPNAELNAAYLSRFEERGVPVVVGHGTSLTVQLPLIKTTR